MGRILLSVAAVLGSSLHSLGLRISLRRPLPPDEPGAWGRDGEARVTATGSAATLPMADPGRSRPLPGTPAFSRNTGRPAAHGWTGPATPAPRLQGGDGAQLLQQGVHRLLRQLAHLEEGKEEEEERRMREGGRRR